MCGEEVDRTFHRTHPDTPSPKAAEPEGEGTGGEKQKMIVSGEEHQGEYGK